MSVLPTMGHGVTATAIRVILLILQPKLALLGV